MSILRDLDTPVFKVDGIPNILTSDFTLEITGLVEKEKRLRWEDILRIPKSRINARLISVTGWAVRADWDGVKWKDFLKEIHLKPEATHATFISHGGIYTTTVSLQDLNAPRVMLVYGAAGDLLEAEYGGPLRTLIPNLYGYKSCKWLTKIDFTDTMKGGYWEDRGYSRDGIIRPGRILDINSGTYREIEGGEILDF